MFAHIKDAIEDIKQGKMIIVIDDPGRENEGDLLMAAEAVTPEAVNFMAQEARGLICVPADASYMEKLQLPPMAHKNTDNHTTAFTVSIDHINTTTGISAGERAMSIKEFTNPASKPESFRRPGHIFPLQAVKGGVLMRSGHTEAAVDFALLAGFAPAGVICEIMNPDGTMARTPQLLAFARKHGLKIVTIEDLIAYRKTNEIHMKKSAAAKLPTKHGEFDIHGFVHEYSGEHHVALVVGNISDGKPVLARLHSECLTGDVFGSHRCDCGEQLDFALKAIAKEGRGVLLYMRQEGRGIGLINKLKAYTLQEQGLDTVEANLKLGFPEDMRDYSAAAQMLKDLGVHSLRLMTNNPQKVEEITKYGVSVEERIPLIIASNKNNAHYLKTKKEKMSHLL